MTMADKNPWSADDWDPQAQAAYIARYGIKRAMARAFDAGTSVHGPRPRKAVAAVKPGVLTGHQESVLALVRRRNQLRTPSERNIAAGVSLGFVESILLTTEAGPEEHLIVTASLGLSESAAVARERYMAASIALGLAQANTASPTKHIDAAPALGFDMATTPIASNILTIHLGVDMAAALVREVSVTAADADAVGLSMTVTVSIPVSAPGLLLEGDQTGALLLEGDQSGFLLLEGTY